MSILYWIVPAVVIGANALFGKKKEPVPLPTVVGKSFPLPTPGVPRPSEIVPGVPDTVKTRAYAEAVAVVERWGKGPGEYMVFNGVSGWMADKKGRPMYPILLKKDLPAAPPGYVWSESARNSDASKSAHTINYWQLGSPPRTAPFAPSTSMTAQLTAGVPDNPKTRAYWDAEILKQHVEVRAKNPGGTFAAVMPPYVYADVLSESELPKASPGFRWVREQSLAKSFPPPRPLWTYVIEQKKPGETDIQFAVRMNPSLFQAIIH